MLVGGALLGRPIPPHFEAASLTLLLSGLCLEGLAPQLPRFGFVSAGNGIWLALALQRPELAWPAALMALAASLVRAVRSQQRGSILILEAMAEIAPLWLALGLAHGALGKPWLAPYLWWLLWHFQPAYLTAALPEEVGLGWSLYRARLGPTGLGLAAAASLSPFLAPLPALRVAQALLMHCLVSATAGVVRGVDAQEQQIGQRRRERGLRQQQVGLEQLEQGLQATDAAQRRTQAELEVRLETYQMVEEMLATIPQRPVFQAVADTIVERLQQRFRVANVVLFWTRDELAPVAWLSPHGDRLETASLTRSSEPAAEKALKTQQLQVNVVGEGQRIFPEDRWNVGVPVSQRGCLYLGHPQERRLTSEDQHFLQVLSRHSWLALEAAGWYQTLQEALKGEAAAAGKNEALVQRLALVIDGVTQLIRLRDPQAMLESAAQILRPLVEHESFFALSGGHRVSQGPTHGDEESLARKVAEQGLPLLLEQPARLAVPLLSERGCLGGIVLTRRVGRFSREDQDILAVLSYQLGSALVTAQLYAELQTTHQALRDSQAQLVQSSKMAAVGQLAGGVAHELNTPLGAVALAIEAAQMSLTTKPDRALTRLERAGKAVQQMKEIVSKLLFYSRDARSGWRETQLNAVIDDTLQLVGHQLRIDGIEVRCQLGELPPFMGNPNELQQIFTNLILNARDAMLSPGAVGKQLLLSTGVWEGGVWCRVQDQGCGMEEPVKERIFEPFFTTKEVGKGTGLGLSVTAQLVQQHQGTVLVDSRPGVGTRFEVRLPLAARTEAQPA